MLLQVPMVRFYLRLGSFLVLLSLFAFLSLFYLPSISAVEDCCASSDAGSGLTAPRGDRQLISSYGSPCDGSPCFALAPTLPELLLLAWLLSLIADHIHRSKFADDPARFSAYFWTRLDGVRCLTRHPRLFPRVAACDARLGCAMHVSAVHHITRAPISRDHI